LQIAVLVLDPSGATASGAGAPAFQMHGAFDVDGKGTVEPGETGVMLTAGGSVLDRHHHRQADRLRRADR
jgi:hypothetical protein